jgi:hypothetical protein
VNPANNQTQFRSLKQVASRSTTSPERILGEYWVAPKRRGRIANALLAFALITFAEH